MSTPVRTLGWVLSGLLILSTACARPHANKPREQKVSAHQPAPFEPAKTYPEWAYDQPEYVKPATEPAAEVRVRPADPLHYFINDRTILVRQPAGYEPDETPRVAMWWTNDDGCNWQLAGYFGRGQSYFPFVADEDGDYGVRFVGPGQPVAEDLSPMPERVYHVDTTAPDVEVTIDPEQAWYQAGDTVTIEWRAMDPHLTEFPVSIGLLMDFTSNERGMIELQRDLADEGSFSYTIAEAARGHEIWFRIAARDRAGNVGLAYSYALQVVEDTLVDVGDVQVTPTTRLQARVRPVATAMATEMSSEEAQAAVQPFLDRLHAWAGAVKANILETSARGQAIEQTMALTAGSPFSIEEVAVASDGPMSEEPPCENEVAAITDSFIDAIEHEAENDAIAPVTIEPVASTVIEDECPDDAMIDAMPEQIAAALSESTDETSAATDIISSAAPLRETPSESALILHNAAPMSGNTSLVGISAYDPTAGNGLLVPLPATIDTPATASVHDHPWRALGAHEAVATNSEAVWTLPNRSGSFGWKAEYEGRFLADHPSLRNVAMPMGAPVFAGSGADDEGMQP